MWASTDAVSILPFQYENSASYTCYFTYNLLNNLSFYDFHSQPHPEIALLEDVCRNRRNPQIQAGCGMCWARRGPSPVESYLDAPAS